MFNVSELSDAVAYMTMLMLSETEKHVRNSLRDAVLLLCQTGLKFNTELSVDGLLAVTVDRQHVFLCSIKETLRANIPCTDDESACQYTNDNNELLNLSSTCLSTVSASDSDNHNVSDDNEHEYAGLPSELPSHCADSGTQLEVVESCSKSEQTCTRRRRKQQLTVCRYLDTPCLTTSPSAVLLSQPDHVLGQMGNENSDMSVCSNDEGAVCVKRELISDVDQSNAHPRAYEIPSADDDVIFSNCYDEECAGRLQNAAEDQQQDDGERLHNTIQLNKDTVTDHVSKQSHNKQKHTIRHYLDSASFPIMSSSTVSSQSEHFSGQRNDENRGLPMLDEVENNRCKMELSDNLSDTVQSECQDFSLHLPDDVKVMKAEIVEQPITSTDSVSQLTSLGHDNQPSSSSNRQQSVATMSQFDFSAVVANMQSQFGLLPKPIPWPVRTFPHVSSPCLPSAQCDMVGIATEAQLEKIEIF